MKKWICFFLSLILLGSCIGSTGEEQTGSELDEAFGTIFKRYRTAGAALIIARNDEIVYQLNYGYSNRKGKEPVDDDTYFLLASVSKFVTAIHAMQLVEKGLLDLDEDLSVYFGYEIRNPYFRNTPLTLRNLMTHTATVKDTGSFSNNARKGLKDILYTGKSRSSTNYFAQKPGSKYHYSNFGAGIIGSLIEKVTGKNLNDSVTEDLFRPLGIDAAYSASLLQNPDDVTYLYSAGGETTFRPRSKSLAKEWDPSVNPEKHFKISYGSLWIRARDLCTLVRMMCNGGTVDGITILQPETVAEMISDQTGKGNITGETPYGLNVHRQDSLADGRMFYGHQGIIENILTNVYFDPESGFVFVLLTNGCSNKQDRRVAGITRRLFTLAWETFGRCEEE